MAFVAFKGSADNIYSNTHGVCAAVGSSADVTVEAAFVPVFHACYHDPAAVKDGLADPPIA